MQRMSCAILFSMEFQLTITSVEGDDEEAIIPDGVSVIGDNAFRGMSNLKRVILPETCTDIGDNAFDACRNLEYINLPASLTSIGAFAFKNCSSLASISLPEGIDTLPKQVFSRCTKLSEVEGIQHIRNIGLDAFTGCVELRSIDASEARIVDDRAFSGCSALEHIELSDNLCRIGAYAFRSCSSLKTISIPDDVMKLGTDLFSGCRDIDIHASETTIRAFPDAFPRKITLACGIIRPQDIRDLAAQFRRNHIDDTNELNARKRELHQIAENLNAEISQLGVMDLKKRDAAIEQLEDVEAEVEEIEALLKEIEHPSLRTLEDEFLSS